jgi:hypothetical protein
MIWAGSSMSRPRDNGYRSVGAQHATGEVAQDRRAPGAPLGACNQVPGTVTRDRPATLALRAAETPLTGRFAGPGMSDPAQRGVRRGKCRSPPVTGVPADPVWQAATRPLRFDLLNVQIFSPPVPRDGGRQPPGALLDHSRCHSPHHRVHRPNRYCLDGRHRRRCGRPHLDVARDGWSRGRRAQTLLLATGPGPAFLVGAERQGPGQGGSGYLGTRRSGCRRVALGEAGLAGAVRALAGPAAGGVAVLRWRLTIQLAARRHAGQERESWIGEHDNRRQQAEEARTVTTLAAASGPTPILGWPWVSSGCCLQCGRGQILTQGPVGGLRG